MAQQCQGRCGEVQAIATAATGLACFIFRFLRRPRVLKARISASDVFIVVAGMYTAHSDWMKWEIETAVANM
jgi:hypothetical protein